LGIIAGVVAVIIIIVVASSVGGGDLNGMYVPVGYSYYAETISFRGQNFTITYGGETITGRYRIKDGRIYMNYMGEEISGRFFRDFANDMIYIDGDAFIRR